jgi:hypothetical protein
MPLKNRLLTQQELMSIPEGELFAKIDEALDGPVHEGRFMLAQLYRDELVRRRQDATNANMWRLTIAIAVLTLVNVLAVIWKH